MKYFLTFNLLFFLIHNLTFAQVEELQAEYHYIKVKTENCTKGIDGDCFGDSYDLTINKDIFSKKAGNYTFNYTVNHNIYIMDVDGNCVYDKTSSRPENFPYSILAEKNGSKTHTETWGCEITLEWFYCDVDQPQKSLSVGKLNEYSVPGIFLALGDDYKWILTTSNSEVIEVVNKKMLNLDDYPDVVTLEIQSSLIKTSKISFSQELNSK
ncbi:hypothetical protein [Flammeovirga sp. SJP92]|uniref:hypothetical protein n=1 Tax=Flammeovirga sp. SJP92 TaxID=1775430 RepID=UPI0007876E72|nr:hypothetical protein [Flammeovirga sp. SJP92]KXX69621.1 hypothetical protein AVL50_16275 [Flammeovirga sp. SJP92]